MGVLLQTPGGDLLNLRWGVPDIYGDACGNKMTFKGVFQEVGAEKDVADGGL